MTNANQKQLRLRQFILAFLIAAVSGVNAAIAQDAWTSAENKSHFAISAAYLEKLTETDKLETSMTVKINGVGPTHDEPSDAEIHIAGTPRTVDVGTPDDIVIEPANVLNTQPPIKIKTADRVIKRNKRDYWREYFEFKSLDKTLVASGFPRIYPEHLTGKVDPSNPKHAFEIHPVTSLRIGNEELSFVDGIKSLKKWKPPKAAYAENTLKGTKLFVRHNDQKDEYELRMEPFRKSLSNWAVIEIEEVNPDWVKSTKGGRSAIALANISGNELSYVKLYTIDGTVGDTWLSSFQSGTPASLPQKVLGMLTFDYFAIAKAVSTVDNGERTWNKPNKWIEVNHPAALVVFGKTNITPPDWQEAPDESEEEGEE